MNKAAIGVDIGGTNVKLGVVASTGRVLFRETFLTKGAGHKRELLRALERRVKALSVKAGHQQYRITGVGIGAPGPIDVKRGLVHFFPNIPGWKDTPLKKLLETRLKSPVYVDNDANVMAYAEYRFGAGRGAKNILALTLGTGIGGGIILDGKLYHGPHFSAAEIGHMVINENGPRCACGNQGCVEAYVGNGYLVRRVKKEILAGERSVLKKWWKKDKKEITPILIELAARAGDRYAKKVWRETGEHLGTALAGLVNVLNPERIILGGGVAKSKDLIFRPVVATIHKKAFPVAASSVKVLPAQLGTDAGLVGAAALALNF